MSTSLHFVHMKYKYEVIINIPIHFYLTSFQFSSVAQSCPTLFDPMNHSTPGLPVHHQLPEFTQTHVHWVGDAIQPSRHLLPPSPPALNLSQHQGLFKWVSSSHQVAKVLEFQLQHESFQWTPRILYVFTVYRLLDEWSKSLDKSCHQNSKFSIMIYGYWSILIWSILKHMGI